MLKFIYVIFIFFSLITFLNSQRVGINTIQIDSSAVFEIASDSLGVLLPRLDSIKIYSILDPAKSLLVFQKDKNEGFKYFDGNQWKSMVKENIECIYINPDSINLDSINNYIILRNKQNEAFYYYDSILNPRQVWFWNGNVALQVFDKNLNSLLTVKNYTELRTLNQNYTNDLIIVTDWTYTGPDGNTYTTIGGIFKRMPKGYGKENGGTLIMANDSTIWERDWDKIHVLPEWWEVGGKDFNGAGYTLLGQIDPDNQNLKIPSGIYNNADRVYSASQVSGEGGVIELGAIIKLYEIDRDIKCKKNQVWNFNGVEFKRANSTTSTATGSISGTTINLNVSNSSGFRVGTDVILLDRGAPYQGQGYNENGSTNPGGVIRIQSISGNSIEGYGFGLSIPSNSLMIRHNILLGEQVVDYGFITINNGIFNGNSTNGGDQLYTDGRSFCADWRMYYSIELGNYSQNVLINNCFFYDTPSENITFAKGKIVNCRFKNLAGSFLHISSAYENLGGEEIDSTGIIIDNLSGVGSNLVGNTIMSHSEGLITFSNSPQNVLFINSNCKNGNEGILSPMTEYGKMRIQNNFFENFRYISILTTSQVDLKAKDLIYSNNRFQKCGDVEFYGNLVNSISNIRIENNFFSNSRVLMVNCENIFICNNNFISDSTYDYMPYNLTTSFPNLKAQIAFKECSNLNIVNNEIIAKRDLDPFLLTAIGYITNSSNAMPNDNDYYYAQNIKIHGNTIENFKRGIGYFNDVFWVHEKEWVGWEISNNLIKMCNNYNGISTEYSFGINIEAGMIAKDNIIYEGYLDPILKNYLNYPLVIGGIDDQLDGNNERQRLRGGIAIGNSIISNPIAEYSIALGTYATSIYNAYNIVLKDNIINRPESGITFAINSSFIDNILITNSQLPELIAPKKINW